MKLDVGNEDELVIEKEQSIIWTIEMRSCSREFILFLSHSSVTGCM